MVALDNGIEKDVEVERWTATQTSTNDRMGR